MPKRDAGLLIEDILAAIAKIESYTHGVHRETFLANDKTIDAVVRNLEIIGEAARRMLGLRDSLSFQRTTTSVTSQTAAAPSAFGEAGVTR